MSDLLHLQTHSVYSLRQSMLTLDALLAEVKARGHQAVALTDIDGLYGMVPFVKQARDAGIQPLLGAELTLAVASLPGDRPARVTLLVRDDAGFRNLSRLISRTHLDGPLAPEELADHAHGLIVLTGGEHGAVPQLVSRGQSQAAQRLLSLWRESFGAADCLVQLGPFWPAARLVALARTCDLGLVAAHGAAYLHPADAKAWDALRMGHGLGHAKPGPRHLATDAELHAAWQELPEALTAMRAIAERCTYAPVFGQPRLPAFTSPGGETSDRFLQRLCDAGLEARYAGLPLYEQARKRLAEELSVIRQMGFVDYFLIAWDLVRFAREAGIPHVPRGSAAGSLVLYVLGISQICPLEHTLCFERFLNLERKGLPDIDLDFHWLRRDEVVDYCYATYGAEHVARIATHQHHGPRGAVRLAGAALGLEEEIISKVSRRMPWALSSDDMMGALARNPECRDLPVAQEPYQSLITTAARFEGLPDHLGLHPCGIVISREPLKDVVPLERSTKGPVVTQFEMHGVEAVGLLKMDLLANRNLAILQDAVTLINRRHGLELVPEQLPLDDPEAFALLRSGRTLGIYQLESGGVQGLLRQFQPSHVEDVTAITSLYRPGPIDGGITPRYVARRHGKEAIVFPDDCLRDILSHTYGCILYQEQCLQVAHVFAGIPLGLCENLRKGIAKRIPPEIAKLKETFFAGARRLGRDPERTEAVWYLLESFGGYGFVKAHAASCAALAVREAYLKARWPVEYLSAVLSSGQGYYPPRVYVEDARAFGAELALPCVNRSEAFYTMEGTNVLRIGLSYLAGIGETGVSRLLQGRKEGPYRSLSDLKQRSGLSRPELETLIRVGACEDFATAGPSGLRPSRPGLLWQLGMLSQGACSPSSRGSLQASLFSLPEEVPPPPADLGDYSPRERQQIENEVLGYTVTVVEMPRVVGAVAFSEARALWAETRGVEAQGLQPEREARRETIRISVVAEIVSRFGHRTKQGEKMVFLTLSDGREQFQGVVFPAVYRRLSPLLRRGMPICFDGTLGDEEGEALLIVAGAEPVRISGGSGELEGSEGRIA
jgi:DNA polymerase-3 subunit alpha